MEPFSYTDDMSKGNLAQNNLHPEFDVNRSNNFFNFKENNTFLLQNKNIQMLPH